MSLRSQLRSWTNRLAPSRCRPLGDAHARVPSAVVRVFLLAWGSVRLGGAALNCTRAVSTASCASPGTISATMESASSWKPRRSSAEIMRIRALPPNGLGGVPAVRCASGCCKVSIVSSIGALKISSLRRAHENRPSYRSDSLRQSIASTSISQMGGLVNHASGSVAPPKWSMHCRDNCSFCLLARRRSGVSRTPATCLSFGAGALVAVSRTDTGVHVHHNSPLQGSENEPGRPSARSGPSRPPGSRLCRAPSYLGNAGSRLRTRATVSIVTGLLLCRILSWRVVLGQMLPQEFLCLFILRHALAQELFHALARVIPLARALILRTASCCHAGLLLFRRL